MDDLTPEQLEQLIALGVIPDEQAMLMQQMEQANALRNAPIPKGEMAGRVYVANPWGALASGYDRYQGAKQGRAVADRYGQTLKDQTAARMAYVNALRRQPGIPQVPQGVQPSPGSEDGF